MQKMTVEYKEKHHILEVDSAEYEIPQRTAALEKKIKEHDSKVSGMSEYDGNMGLLEILFGKEVAEKMFPDGDNTNLDKLAQVTKAAIALYMYEYHEAEKRSAKEKMDELKPMLSAVNDIAKAANNAQMKKFVSGKKK